MDIAKKYLRVKNISLEFPILETKHRSIRHQILNFSFQQNRGESNKTFKALKNISFELLSGDRLAILGENGAGKTTLLRLLSDVYAPSNGEIEKNGKCISFIDLIMGMNFEASGRENILIRGILHGLTIKEINRLENQIIEFSGLSEFIDRPIKVYSTGMLMRLGFSIITSIKSDFIIMDEWLSTGDEGFQRKAEQKLLNIIDSSHILILATHSQELVSKICNKIIKLEHGEVTDFISIT
jgi:lipopolysaccharide transport system ATP-binding protein